MSRMASRAPIATSAPTAKIRIVCSFPGSRTPRRYEVPPRRASPESGHGRWNPRRKTATRRCPRRAEARGQGIRPSSRARATASVRLAAPSGAPLGSARLATPDHYPTILLRKTLGDMRGSIDLGYDDGDDRPGEGSAESSEIADDDFPALALNIPPGFLATTFATRHSKTTRRSVTSCLIRLVGRRGKTNQLAIFLVNEPMTRPKNVTPSSRVTAGLIWPEPFTPLLPQRRTPCSRQRRGASRRRNSTRSKRQSGGASLCAGSAPRFADRQLGTGGIPGSPPHCLAGSRRPAAGH